LIYTPTMRVAEPVQDTLNAYIAFRSALVLMKNANIDAASTSLFCTGAGEMSVLRACKQMKEAYISVMSGNLLGGKRWPDFHAHHRYLRAL
jgi:hypothetical protein